MKMYMYACAVCVFGGGGGGGSGVQCVRTSCPPGHLVLGLAVPPNAWSYD